MTAGVVLGQAVLELTTDDGKFSSGLAAARGKAEGTLTGIGKTAAGVAAGIIGAQGLGGAFSFVKNSIFGLGAAYEQELNILQAVSGASADEMRQLGSLSKALGADLTLPATSAKDAAAAMLELAKAGLSVNDVQGAAKGVLQLSAAGALSNARAAEIAANALNAFGLEGTEAVRIADLLAAAANRSSLEVSDAADSMQMASAVYAAAGVPIEDLVTLISELGNAGIKGSDAGTSLKQMLLQLQTPTNKAKDLMRDLGFEVYDASGNMYDMRTLVGNLQKSMSGLTQQERDYALGVIFGSDAVRAANVLLKEGVAGFDEMKVAVTEQGAAADLAAARNKGLKGALDGFKSAVETLQISLGNLVSGPLEWLVRKMSGAVNQIEPLSHLLKLGFDGGQIGGNFSTIERAVFNFGQTMGNVHQTVSEVLGTLGHLFKLGLEGGQIGGDWNGWERAAFAFGKTLREDIIPAAQDVAKWLRDDVLPAAKKVGEWLLDPVLPAIADFVKNDVWPKVSEMFTVAARIFKEDLVPAAKELAPIIWNNLGDLLKWFSDHKEAVVAVVAAFVTFKTVMTAAALVEGIIGVTTAIWGMNAAMLANPVGLLAVALAALVAVGILVYKNWDDIKAAVQRFADRVQEWVGDHKALAAGILLLLGPIGLVIAAGVYLYTHWDELKEKAGQLKDWIVDKFNALKDGAVEKLGDLVGWVASLPGKLMDALGDLAGWLLGKGKDLIGGLLEGAKDKAGDLLNWVFSLPGKILDEIPDPLRVMLNIGKQIVQGLIDGVKSMLSSVTGAVGDVIGAIPDTAKKILKIFSPSQVFVEIGELTMEGLANGITDGSAGVQSALMSVADMVAKWGQEVLAQMSDDYKAAVAISMAIAAEAAKGSSGVAVLTNDGMAAAVTTSASAVDAAVAVTPMAAAVPVVTGDPGIDRLLSIMEASNADIAAQQAAALANGGLINRPTFALIGEDIRTRPEIVSPEALMRRIVREEGGGAVHAVDVKVFLGGRELTDIVDVRITERNQRQLRAASLAGGF